MFKLHKVKAFAMDHGREQCAQPAGIGVSPREYGRMALKYFTKNNKVWYSVAWVLLDSKKSELLEYYSSSCQDSQDSQESGVRT